MNNLNWRPPLPRLSTILRSVGNDPCFEERWVNALFDAAFRLRTSDFATIQNRAALNVALEFETLVRARCSKANRDWRWSTSQRKLLAKSIINAPLIGYEFYYLARVRSRDIIEATQTRVDNRHYWMIVDVSRVDPRDTRLLWLGYSLHPDNRCSTRDHAIVFRAIFTCRPLLEALFGLLD